MIADESYRNEKTPDGSGLGSRAVQPVGDPDLTLRKYCSVLETDAIDFHGARLSSGTRVLCDPLVRSAFLEDTPVNRDLFRQRDCTWREESRQKVWFPPVNGLSAEFLAHTERLKGFRDDFQSSTRTNLTGQTGSISPVKLVDQGDLTGNLVSELMVHKSCGVPPEVSRRREWIQFLQELNWASWFVLRLKNRSIRLLAAFVTPLRFSSNPGLSQPFADPSFPPADRSLVSLLDRLDTRTSSFGGRRTPEIKVLSLGSGLRPDRDWEEGELLNNRGWLVLTTWYQENQVIHVHQPRVLKQPPGWAELMDRIRPETIEHKINRIQEYIDTKYASGFQGAIVLDWIVEDTGYPRTTVHQAIDALEAGTRNDPFRYCSTRFNRQPAVVVQTGSVVS